MPQIVDWYDRHLAYTPIESRETARTEEEVVWLEKPRD
jgi:hypothetical protein